MPEYKVQAILDQVVAFGEDFGLEDNTLQTLCKVHWKGYPVSESTWEPRASVAHLAAYDDFVAQKEWTPKQVLAKEFRDGQIQVQVRWQNQLELTWEPVKEFEETQVYEQFLNYCRSKRKRKFDGEEKTESRKRQKTEVEAKEYVITTMTEEDEESSEEKSKMACEEKEVEKPQPQKLAKPPRKLHIVTIPKKKPNATNRILPQARTKTTSYESVKPCIVCHEPKARTDCISSRHWTLRGDNGEMQTYHTNHRILILGEGNFSFTVQIAKKLKAAGGNPAYITSSCYQYVGKPAEGNIAYLKDQKVTITHNIDACNAQHLKWLTHLNGDRKFDRILFTFPRAQGKPEHMEHVDAPEKLVELTDRASNQQFMRNMFQNLKSFLTPGGTIDIMFHKRRGNPSQVKNWKISSILAGADLTIDRMLTFDTFPHKEIPLFEAKNSKGLRTNILYTKHRNKTSAYPQEGRFCVIRRRY